VVGAIAYNAAPSGHGLCGSGISMIPTNGPDTSVGTHVFVAGAFSYNNINAPGCSGANSTTDGEGIIFDSWACSSYKYQGVAEQNMLWHNGSAAIEVFPNCTQSNDLATYYLFNNTSYGNYQDPYHTGNRGELAIQNITPATGSYNVYNNIFVATTVSTDAGLDHMVGGEIWCDNNCTSRVVAASNYMWQSNPGTSASAGNPNTDVWLNGSHNTTSFPFGTNTYNDPGFASPKTLLTTAPNCSNQTNTTTCMIAEGVVNDLTPSGGAVGLGYQPPGPCTADAYFPTWLKGVVYLSWNGTSLSENSGLITRPCGM
jgi:hypothetical protein